MILTGANKSTWMDEIHPLVKIAAAAIILIAALTVLDPLNMAAYLLVLTVALVLSGCGRYMLKTSVFLLPLALLVMIINVLVGTDLERTLVAGMRVMTIAVSMSMFAFTTTPAQLVGGLESMKAPRKITLALMVMLRFIPVFIRDMDRVRKSNRLRGGPQRRRFSVRYRSFMMPVISRIYTLSDTITLGLHTRAFNLEGPRTNMNVLCFKTRDYTLLLGFILLTAMVILL